MIYAMEKRWFGEGGGCGMISRKLEGEKNFLTWTIKEEISSLD